jgi:ATP-dependent Clp protease ATP-binding subunit ClpB
LKRVIQRELGDSIALAILEGNVAEGDTVTVDAEAGDFTVSTVASVV